MTAMNITNIFAKSPLLPMQQHMHQVHLVANKLNNFFAATLAQQWLTTDAIQSEVAESHVLATQLKREIRLQLPKGLFLPVARVDLLELLNDQDRLFDEVRQIVNRVVERQFVLPEVMQQPFLDFVKHCVVATGQAHDLVNEFDALLEYGFQGREVELVERLIDRLDQTETETEQMESALRRKLNSIETTLNTIDVVFLYGIIDRVGHLARLAENIGSRLELMIAR